MCVKIRANFNNKKKDILYSFPFLHRHQNLHGNLKNREPCSSRLTVRAQFIHRAMTHWGEKRVVRRGFAMAWYATMRCHNVSSVVFFFFCLSRRESKSNFARRYLDKIRGAAKTSCSNFQLIIMRCNGSREERRSGGCVRASSKLPPPGQPRKSVSERAETTPLWYPMSLLANSATGGPLIRAACSREQPENPEGNSNSAVRWKQRTRGWKGWRWRRKGGGEDESPLNLH